MQDSLSTQATLALLANTTDPMVAARLADRLELSLIRTHPLVKFPPAWVEATAKGPLERAVFAVLYCDDPDALSAIALRDRRVAVRRALASNPCLSDADRSRLALETCASHPLLSQQFSTPHPWTTERVLAAAINDVLYTTKTHTIFAAILDIIELIRQDPTSYSADTALLALSKGGQDFLARSFLSTYYRAHYVHGDGLWDRVTVSPVEVLRALPERDRQQFLHSLLDIASFWPGPGRPYDLEVTKLLVDEVNPRRVHWPTVDRNPGAKFFTPEALDYIIDLPDTLQFIGWSIVLVHHDLDAIRFQRVEARLEECTRTILVPSSLHPRTGPEFARLATEELSTLHHAREMRHAYTNPTLVIDALSYNLPPGTWSQEISPEELVAPFEFRRVVEAVFAATPTPKLLLGQATRLLSYLDDPRDPYVARILAATDEFAELLDYLAGRLHLHGNVPLLPDVKDVPFFVGRLYATTTEADPIHAAQTFRALHLPACASTEYYEAVLDHLPGVAVALLSDPRANKIIHDRLAASDSDLDVALDQLVVAGPYATLSQICSTVALLCADHSRIPVLV